MGAIEKPLLLLLLEHFDPEVYTPSAGLYGQRKFAAWGRLKIYDVLRTMSNPSLVITDENGSAIYDLRLLEKDPDTGPRNAIYRLTPYGVQQRDEVRHLLQIEPEPT